MGLDLLDLSYHLERSFGVRLTTDDWTALWMAETGGERDFTMAQVYDLILERLEREAPAQREALQVTWDRESVWAEVSKTFAECLGVDLEEVTPDARLVGDLGME